MSPRDLELLSSFVAQAKQYYRALPDLEPVAKPLVAYYFALNLTKAFLCLVDPDVVRDVKSHGLSEAFERKTRYFFSQEQFKVQKRGVFRLLAEQTGMGYCYPSGHVLRVDELLPYLPDAYDLYADSTGDAPKLLPLDDAYPLFGSKQGWLRVEIDWAVLRQRNISAAHIREKAFIFGSTFDLVQDSNRETASYESKETFSYGSARAEILAKLSHLFDRSLFAVQRNFTDGRRFIVISRRNELLSHEAVTFAILHHLSNMVRYRPQEVEKLRGSKHFWLFASWVDRACENFLLSLATRMTGEEHIIA